MKKRWLAVALTLAIVATAVVTAGGALADDADTTGASGISSFASRVAAILGLGESEVQDAIHQAQTELRNEAMQARLEALVEAGDLTQEQADALLEWQESMPDVMPGFGGRGLGPGEGGFGGGMREFGRGHGHGHGRGGFGGFEGFPMNPPAPADEVTPSAEGVLY